ncbi:unnamed protein product [Arabidopsis arenosa]|uniref:Uncharacterized protein n=1 Tax=Arabidopsis arenosa TaxID=38785 RepID=A0A8S2APN0_ARAAE|nr:unnamed protein product [Arabidopsis arenosa]
MVRWRTIQKEISALFSFWDWRWFEASWYRIWGAKSSPSASLVPPARDPNRPKYNGRISRQSLLISGQSGEEARQQGKGDRANPEMHWEVKTGTMKAGEPTLSDNAPQGGDTIGTSSTFRS